MMKSLLFVLMLSGSSFALSAQAFAQSSPNTTETDQSEEDWRKSQKKGGTSTEDILDIITNTRNSGVGNGRGYSPIDALPEESRRHLMKERAKRMAQAGPNEPVDVSYTPSEGAKSDSGLEADEKAAWEEMSKGMNGTTDQGQQGQGQGQQGGGSGSQGQQGQQGGASGSQGQQGQQQVSGQSSNGSGQNGQSRSVMRGGSANSVSDIMARIKGLSPGSGSMGQGQGQGQSQGPSQGQGQSPLGQSPSGQSPYGQTGQGQSGQGQSGQGQAPSGQANQGQGQQSGQAPQGQSQQGQSQQGQSQQGQTQQGQGQQDQSQQGQSHSQSQAQAEAQAQAQAQAAQQAASQAQSSIRTPEATSPLDNLKEMRREQSTSGTRSSASDYLKQGE